MEEDKNVTRYAFAIIFTPILLISFVWLEEIAKGSELYYWGNLIVNRFFVEIMFAAFIPLAIGTFLLLFCRIEEAPRLLKYILYAITVLSLISTLFVAHSLATVPRGGTQNSFAASPDTFAGNITRRSTGEYRGIAYQTVFTQSYTTSMVVAFGPTLLGKKEGNLGARLETTKPVNLSGTLHLYTYLYRRTQDYGQGTPLYFSFSEKTISFEGSSLWSGKIWGPEIRWGSAARTRPHTRMRLEGYKIVFLVLLELEGSDYGDVIPFTAHITGGYDIIDFQVDSSLQNGVAILLCGVFIGIYVQILGKPIIRRVRLSRRRRGLGEEKGDIKRDDLAEKRAVE